MDRIYSFDILRILSIFLVVVIHVTSKYYYFTNIPFGECVFITIINSLTCLAVPMFFMLSGALAGKKMYNSWYDLWEHRIKRLFVPFVVWSLIYVIAKIAIDKTEAGIISVLKLWNTPAYYQFWFMYSYFAICILLPVIQIITRNIQKKTYIYLLIVWFVTSSILPFLGRYNENLLLSDHFDLVIVEGYLGYFLLGNYVVQYKDTLSKKSGVIIGIVGLMGNISLNLFPAMIHKQLSLNYVDNLSPFVVLLATGVLVLFLKTNFFKVGVRRKRAMNVLSNIIFGIYFIHMLILKAIETICDSCGGYIYFDIVWQSLAVFLVSALITYGISKIKHVRFFLLGMKN